MTGGQTPFDALAAKWGLTPSDGPGADWGLTPFCAHVKCVRRADGTPAVLKLARPGDAEAAREAAAALVRSGTAFCLASDGHPGTRDHTQQLGFHLLLRAGASSVQAWRLTQANPRFLLREGISTLPLDELAVA